MMSISIVIPAYNEEKRIRNVLVDYYSFFSEKKADFELIVVANNCSDSTSEVVIRFSKTHPKCRLLDIKRKIGKGGAVKAGFGIAQKNVVCFVDADDSTPAIEFWKILQALPLSGLAIGSRALSDSRIIGQPEYRKFLGRSFNFLVNLLFGLGLHDTQCGAKIFSKKTIRIMQAVESNFFEFDVELLWRAKKKGYPVVEVPITWTDATESKVNFWSIPNMFIGLMRIRFFLKFPPKK